MIIGLNKTLRKLRQLAHKHGHNPSVIVGYSANYALPVHERVNVPHRVGQAKYLEQPARELSKELGKITSNATRAGMDLHGSLLIAGRRLQRESQLLVPVNLGHLKGSAFTEKE